MDRKLFTEEEIKILKENKYVKNVSKTNITYTDEFKDDYAKLIKNGKDKNAAFIDLGLDPEILGFHRVKGVYRRIKSKLIKNDNLSNKRGKLSTGRKKTKFNSPEEQLEYLKHENLVLKQENAFLKKMELLAKKKK